MTESKRPLTYRDAGVDIDAGNELVKRIAPVAKRTTRPEVLGGLGGFGALCELPSRYKNPVLVAGTDGVGTKLRLAIDTGRHDKVGIDLLVEISTHARKAPKQVVTAVLVKLERHGAVLRAL